MANDIPTIQLVCVINGRPSLLQQLCGKVQIQAEQPSAGAKPLYWIHLHSYKSIMTGRLSWVNSFWKKPYGLDPAKR